MKKGNRRSVARFVIRRCCVFFSFCFVFLRQFLHAHFQVAGITRTSGKKNMSIGFLPPDSSDSRVDVTAEAGGVTGAQRDHQSESVAVFALEADHLPIKRGRSHISRRSTVQSVTRNFGRLWSTTSPRFDWFVIHYRHYLKVSLSFGIKFYCVHCVCVPLC